MRRTKGGWDTSRAKTSWHIQIVEQKFQNKRVVQKQPCDGLRWFKQQIRCQKDVKLSKGCQILKRQTTGVEMGFTKK